MAEQDIGYVERMYASSDDPWRISRGRYEERKRDVLLACLPEARYRSGFEPACGTGVLTEQLAARCDALLATDVSPRAVELTVRRAPGVVSMPMRIPRQWPEGRFDLIVLSEFGYYLTTEDWLAVAEQVAASLTDRASVLACHWRHPFAERLLDTDWLHERLGAALPGYCATQVRDVDFRLDVWTTGASLAERDELL